SRFRNERGQARHAVGTFSLISTAPIPYTIEPGQLIAATASGLTYRNVTGGVIPSASPTATKILPLLWRADLAGEAANAAFTWPNVDDRVPVTLVTALAG